MYSSRVGASCSSAARAAHWTSGGLHEAEVLISLPIASTTSGCATAKPIRQPLMLYDLLKVYAATAWSSIPGCARIDSCRPPQTMWQYGSSEKTTRSVPRTTSAIAARSSRVATPPVGLWGEFRKTPRGLGSVSRKRLTSSARGRNPCSAASGARTARAPRRWRFGT